MRDCFLLSILSLLVEVVVETQLVIPKVPEAVVLVDTDAMFLEKHQAVIHRQNLLYFYQPELLTP
jgi:hypothetical protein